VIGKLGLHLAAGADLWRTVLTAGQKSFFFFGGLFSFFGGPGNHTQDLT
jgi:hypothetical protein